MSLPAVWFSPKRVDFDPLNNSVKSGTLGKGDRDDTGLVPLHQRLRELQHEEKPR